MEPNVTVVVNQPLDWVAGVLIPVASILVAAVIAIYLARNERIANDESHQRAQAARVSGALIRIGRAMKTGDTAGANVAVLDFAAEINALGALVSKKDLAVGQYCSIVLNKATRTNDAKAIARTTNFLSTALEMWAQKEKKAKDFVAAMPDDDGNTWTSKVNLTHWEEIVEVK